MSLETVIWEDCVAGFPCCATLTEVSSNPLVLHAMLHSERSGARSKRTLESPTPFGLRFVPRLTDKTKSIPRTLRRPSFLKSEITRTRSGRNGVDLPVVFAARDELFARNSLGRREAGDTAVWAEVDASAAQNDANPVKTELMLFKDSVRRRPRMPKKDIGTSQK